VIDWPSLKRVLVVRLRSIGDTVLATPSLIALKRFLPHAEIDILLEDWVAPLLEGHDAIDNVIATGKTSTERLKTAREIRKRRYDVVFNLHGGTTSTYFVAASKAKHRVGYKGYRYSFVYNHGLSSSADFWKREKTHSAEQQLALLGYVGVPVEDRPRSQLFVTKEAARSRDTRLFNSALHTPHFAFALMHPASAFHTKTWATENFARTAEYLAELGLQTIGVAANHETDVLEKLKEGSKAPIITFNDLSLPEITALASKAMLFVGNDSGIAHIAAAVNTPTVVVFGSSNRDHWRPWTDAPNEIVFNQFPCQPCPGYECKEFGDPKCILSVPVVDVEGAIDRVLAKK
jgi:ADP-heptose:LPS heptosyltransferase